MNRNYMVVVFRSHLDPAAGAEYAVTVERMEHLARSTPGFLSFKTFSASDGERVSIVEFESEESVAAWRRHPEHVDAQRRGREAFCLDYKIQVLAPIHERIFERSRRDALP